MKTIRFNKSARKILFAVALTAIAALFLGLRSGSSDDRCGELVTERDERVAYLSSLGWEVDPDSEVRQEILLPRQFDATLTRYNELQKQQGFDLSDYAGLNASLIAYTVCNYPDKNQTVIAELYIVKDRIIGGDIHSTALDGFMIGIR